jgi:NCS1 family nucleobase:cation symporter-1
MTATTISFIKKLEVDSETELTRWINDDFKPIEAEHRTWTFWTFHNYCKFI